MGQYFWGNPLSSYLLFAATVVGSFLAARIAKYLVDRWAAKWALQTESQWDDVIIDAVLGPATWLVAIGGARIAQEGLILTERAELWFTRVLTVASIIVVFVGIYRLIKGSSCLLVEEYVKRTSSRDMSEEEKEAEGKSIARITRQINEIAGMVVILLGVLTSLSNLGVDLKAVWASLGVGGIALALAVKDPLSNFIGRMVIYSTGLFEEGHFIQIDKWEGTVTRIGTFRTSIELISDMSTVTIPNIEFIQKPVKTNYGRKKFIFKWDLDVPYDVDAARLEELVEALRALIKEKPEVLEEFSFVYLDRLGEYSKVVRVWFQARLPDFPSTTGYRTRLLGEIQRLFADRGIDFAFPTYSVAMEPAKTDTRQLAGVN